MPTPRKQDCGKNAPIKHDRGLVPFYGKVGARDKNVQPLLLNQDSSHILSRVAVCCFTCVLQECGVALEDFNEFKEGDVVQCFTLEEIKATV